MKLSQMSTEHGLERLAGLVPYISELLEDAELLKLFNGKKPEDEPQWKFGLKRILALVPAVTLRHTGAVYGMLSLVNGREEAEIRKQSILQTMRDVKELIQDEDLRSFFSSPEQSEPTM